MSASQPVAYSSTSDRVLKVKRVLGTREGSFAPSIRITGSKRVRQAHCKDGKRNLTSRSVVPEDFAGPVEVE